MPLIEIRKPCLTGQLTGSYQAGSIDGVIGIRILKSELAAKLPIFIANNLTPAELSKRLGLEYAELKQLHQLHLLPFYPTPKGFERRIRNSVSAIMLDQFLDRFQTARSAAAVLKIEESELQRRVGEAGICPSSDAGGRPLY